jgi:spermidine synthase
MKTLQLDIPDRSVGAVGLGTGSILCYSKPHEHWTFFEIDPHVEAIARNPKLFTFLSTCPVKANVVIGDARLTMAREPSGKYSMLVLDAFSSDAIPVHLLTREALKTYRRIMTDRGILFVHISNRRLELEPVVGALARDAGMFALIRNHEQSDRKDNFEYGSDWVVLSSREAEFAPLARDKRWRAVVAGNQLWTDDYSNLFSVIKW